ncbi:unnamed protein product [Owenia fusiformis]|uniref:Profilin n=1 Tax=Owenia fusiformis TaxID=6347 RepID=A0A8J1Y0L7_OWEFU|nr:unnamed protein product [Owenia fusiformis]
MADMTWNAWIDSLISNSRNLKGEPQIDKACIIGLRDGGLWHRADHPNALILKEEEANKIARVFRGKEIAPFVNDGIPIAGHDYVYFDGDDVVDVVAKGRNASEDGIYLYTSKTAIVIGHCPSMNDQTLADKTISDIAQKLKDLEL